MQDPLRQTLLDQLDFMTDPTAGQSVFTQMALDATPGLDTFATQAAMRGGSFAQAREAQEAAQSRARGQALSGFSQNQLRRQQGATQGLLSLMNLDQDQAQFRQRMALERRPLKEETSGPGIGGVLGGLAGTVIGSVAGPFGATIGGKLGGSLADRIFGSFGEDGNEDVSLSIDPYGIGNF